MMFQTTPARRLRWLVVSVASSTVCCLLLAASSAIGQETTEACAVYRLEHLTNAESSFLVRVDVDRPDRSYRLGDQMTISVKAEQECYLYLFAERGDGVECLYPNWYQPNNLVPGGLAVTIPAAEDPFHFVCSPPLGTDTLRVIACRDRLFELPWAQLAANQPTFQISSAEESAITTELLLRSRDTWAESRIEVATQRQDIASRTARRLAVVVGISQYEHERIPRLEVSHSDAIEMARVLQNECEVDDVVLLVDAEATRAAIEQAIFVELVQKSQPGDTIFLYFSCHGGRTSDTNFDEQDGLDEYLVPFDGRYGEPDTMILDDVMTRWIRELDGRQIGIILDNCYAGGSHKSIKGLGDRPQPGRVDFMDGEVRRAKQIGQSNLVVLAACEARQLAWEMPGSGSVFTHHLLQTIRGGQGDTNQDGQLTLQEAYWQVRDPVAVYVNRTFQARQSPVLLDHAEEAVILRP